jgi:exopolysaccharide biosynthesis protein
MKKKKLVRAALLDIAAAALLVGGFLTNFYLLPHSAAGAGTVLASEDSEDGTGKFTLPDSGGTSDGTGTSDSTETSDGAASETSGNGENAEDSADSGTAGSGESETSDSTESASGKSKSPSGRPGSGSSRQSGMTSGNTNTKSITADTSASSEIAGLAASTETVKTYKSDSLEYTVTKTTLGEGSDTITYYTADIYLTDITQLRTAFADGTYGKNYRESVQTMAEENSAILAVSGDSYGNSESGIVVRNGVLYRDETNDAEICVLFKDGTMKIYTPEEFDSAGVLEKDVWQAWNFGPSLLDNGEVKTSFQTTDYLNGKNPRCAIGYISPGHYKLVVVDGRNEGYSAGATMSELAAIMQSEGCTLAYNLDGGKSAEMVLGGETVNQPAGGGREISDIIYIQE